MKTSSNTHLTLRADRLTVAISIALATSGSIHAQTATNDDFSAIVRSVPQLLGNVLDNDNGATDAQVSEFPNRGTIDLQTDGVAVYTPTLGSACSAASDSFSYQNSTGQNAVVNINLLATGVADSFTVPSDQILTDDVQTNDRLPVNAMGDPVNQLDVVAFQFVDNGMVEQIAPGVTNQTGQFRFTPDPGFSGLAGFEYGTQDDDLGCLINTVAEILVTPVANQDQATVPGAQETCGIDVLANDIGTDLVLLSVSSPDNGTASIDVDGSVCFLPDVSFAGPTDFNYTLEDGFGSQVDGLVSLLVENQAPTADDDSFQTLANTPVSDNLLSNDSDPNGDMLSVIANTQPGSGTVSVASSGAFTYTPDTGISGTDAFEYTASDGQGGESTATVNLAVLPVAPDQSFDGVIGQLLTGNLLTDSIGTGLSVVANTQPANGSLTVQPNGDFVFEPPPAFGAAENFGYTVRDIAGNEASGTVTLGISLLPEAVPGLNGAPLGLLALLLGWLGWRRLD